ncbi:MAG: hypothetical protein HQM12_11970 [SAR324 cluster bacterium]|nr:hypothetical protein [SAR324 cluster bacterium]
MDLKIRNQIIKDTIKTQFKWAGMLFLAHIVLLLMLWVIEHFEANVIGFGLGALFIGTLWASCNEWTLLIWVGMVLAWFLCVRQVPGPKGKLNHWAATLIMLSWFAGGWLVFWENGYGRSLACSWFLL